MNPSSPTSEQPGGSSFWTSRPFRFFLIILVLALSAIIFVFRQRFAELATIGYPGIFLVSLLGNATIILPAPSLAMVFAMGSALPPVLVGLAAGIGEALGELTGYAAGFGGRAVIENQDVYDRMAAWMQRRGGITVFVLSVIPNPVFDLAGIAAGTLHYPLWRFLLFCWLGKTIKTTLMAWAGSQSIAFIEQLLR
ncbi:MAG: VTT domain-containing protein [Anaerolineae bacterium]|jgi:membrane protein YqaA with SNARE-associated domain